MPFLTDLDSRAAIKGSRDPLGLVPIWSRFGRYIIGNLTTVSNSLRGFTTLLLGYYFAEEVREREGHQAQSALDLFLKFEQLAAYARWHVAHDGDFRGHDRVVRRLQEASKVFISADPADQILGDQKTYGLWGLFSVPARSSGLLAPDEPVLTPPARQFVEEHYIARLTADGLKAGRPLLDILRRDRAHLNLAGQHATLVQSIARILAPALSQAERQFYDHYLVDGGDDDTTHGRQSLLGDLLVSIPRGVDFGMTELKTTIQRASRHRDGEPLADRLESIAKLESLLVPMASAFGFLLTRDRQQLATVAREVRTAWKRSLGYLQPDAIAELRVTIAAAFHDNMHVADRFVETATALSAGAYDHALQLLCEQNAYVMQARNGSQPWVRINRGTIDVRYRDEGGALLPAQELPHCWRNTYFINSLHDIVASVEAA